MELADLLVLLHPSSHGTVLGVYQAKYLFLQWQRLHKVTATVIAATSWWGGARVEFNFLPHSDRNLLADQGSHGRPSGSCEQPCDEGAFERPVYFERSLDYFIHLFLLPKKMGDMCPVTDLYLLNNHLIKSPRSGVTLCFQFVSAASAAAAAPAATTSFAYHVKTVSDKPYIFGTKNLWVWGNVLDDLSMTLTQGHGCGID